MPLSSGSCPTLSPVTLSRWPCSLFPKKLWVTKATMSFAPHSPVQFYCPLLMTRYMEGNGWPFLTTHRWPAAMSPSLQSSLSQTDPSTTALGSAPSLLPPGPTASLIFSIGSSALKLQSLFYFSYQIPSRPLGSYFCPSNSTDQVQRWPLVAKADGWALWFFSVIFDTSERTFSTRICPWPLCASCFPGQLSKPPSLKCCLPESSALRHFSSDALWAWAREGAQSISNYVCKSAGSGFKQYIQKSLKVWERRNKLLEWYTFPIINDVLLIATGARWTEKKSIMAYFRTNMAIRKQQQWCSYLIRNTTKRLLSSCLRTLSFHFAL